MTIRLLETDSFRLASFLSTSVPPYAILSHTWDATGEVTFQDISDIHKDANHPARMKAGFRKIIDTCQRARLDGFEYCWIDTCCIDKTSSSELSEAINSMFRWYQEAAVCYVLFTDYKAISDADEDALRACRWFTRGWCLQELLAPRRVEFVDSKWKNIGSKTVLASIISNITLVPVDILTGHASINSLPVAKKLSWAANRQTTRTEDIAYCLLGILQINMPILYGEGPMAFIRLQEEITKHSNDLSLFAALEMDTHHHTSQPYRSLFAESPRDFLLCCDLVYTRNDTYQNDAYALTNRGIHFSQVNLQVDFERGLYVLLLNCKHASSTESDLGIRIQQVGPNLYVRCDKRFRPKKTFKSKAYVQKSFPTVVKKNIYIISHLTTTIQAQLLLADEYAIHVSSCTFDLPNSLQIVERSLTSECWDISQMYFLTKGRHSFHGYWKFFPIRAIKDTGVKISGQLDNHCYLFCGFEKPENGSAPKAWVYMLSSREWQKLERTHGIITHLSEALRPFNFGNTRSQINIGMDPSDGIMATASLIIDSQRRIFELKLELDIIAG